MKDLFFWVQSLDNQSPDEIFEDGKKLSEGNSREIVSDIYSIPGKKLDFKSELVTVRSSSDKKFVIEAISTKKDQLDRLAPVVIYGELPPREKLSDDWIKYICEEIEVFVKGELINRELSKDAIEDIKKWLEKKKTTQDRKYNASLAILILLPLIAGGILQSVNIQLSIAQVAYLIALNNLCMISVQKLIPNGINKKIKT